MWQDFNFLIRSQDNRQLKYKKKFFKCSIRTELPNCYVIAWEIILPSRKNTIRLHRYGVLIFTKPEIFFANKTAISTTPAIPWITIRLQHSHYLSITWKISHWLTGMCLIFVYNVNVKTVYFKLQDGEIFDFTSPFLPSLLQRCSDPSKKI